MMKRAIASLLLSASLALPADLPVKQVVLYKHGIGYFERSGKLAAGESARLEFDASEMDDVLKSLTVGERGGGKITGLRYDAMDPLSRRLAGFPFQIAGGQPLSGMLDQLRGARLELKLASETVAGAIVNARLAAGGDRQPEREQLTLLLDSGDMRTLDLGAASGIRFTDTKLQQQFRDYLGAVAAARSKDKRSLWIDSTGQREREVSASYTIPSAVWKSSYRLIFGGAAEPVLEGWAIVDNTTGEDWTGVVLSLVSGRPISFVSRLYAPRYIERAVAELPEERAARPVIHEGAYAQEAADAPQRVRIGGNAAMMKSSAGAVIGGIMGSVASAAPPPPPRMEAIRVDAVAPSTIVSTASAGELGELFEYRIAQPVTIRKDESAMLPFLQQPIAARKLLIYSSQGSQHPTNAAEITNTSGKTLDGGPITVYDAGAYGGEALMETLKTGDKRLISYAVDLGTRITEAFGGKQALVRELHASRGILTTKLAAEETRTYTVRNVDQKVKTLIIEHPLRNGYTLLNRKPAEKTATAYRFELRLAPGASEEFPISEERVFEQTYGVTNLTPDVLVEYARNKSLSDAGRKQLEAIAAQKGQIADNDRTLRDVEKQISTLVQDQARIRENIRSLNNVNGQQQQVQNYARQLESSETQLAGLRDRQAEMQKKKSALESSLNRLIEALSF